MVNPGSFGSSQKAFLTSQKPAYSAGVVGGYAADALVEIQRKYHKRFLIDLPHDEEPSEEWSASVNDEEPYTEQVAPDIEALSEEEYAGAMDELGKRQKLVAFRQAVSNCQCLFVRSMTLFNHLISKLNDGLPTNT